MSETMEDLKASIVKIVKSRFPESYLVMRLSSLGGSSRPSLGVYFALGKEDAWPSHIIHNDPGHTVFLVHTKADEHGNISDLELSSNIHGYDKVILYPATQTYGSDKAGWRDIKKPTNIAGVEKNLIKYFDRMQEIHAEQIKSLESTPQPEPQQTDAFFEKAFADPKTNRPYQIPGNIRQLSERLCKDNNIKGTSDPMYIANITAFELGLGNGQSDFVSTRSTSSVDLDRLTNRINSAYRSNITDPPNTRAEINRLCAPFIMTPEELKAVPEFKYIVTIKDKNDKDVVYGFYDKTDISNYVNELNKNGKYISYSISDNKQEQAMTDKIPHTTDLMSQLIKAGIKPEQMGNHASDLYVEVNDISKAIIKDYQFKQNVTTFHSNIDGKLNYEIPFAYTPSWDKNQKSDTEKTAPGLPHHCYSKNEETEQSLAAEASNLAVWSPAFIGDKQTIVVCKNDLLKVQFADIEDVITTHGLKPVVNYTLTQHGIPNYAQKDTEAFTDFCRQAQYGGMKLDEKIVEWANEGEIKNASLVQQQEQGVPIPVFPNLTQTEAKELTDFTTTVTKAYPNANPENLTKLCVIAGEMTTLTIQNARGTLSNEKYNSLTDSQEKQIGNIIAKDLPGTKPLFSYNETAPAIKLRTTDDTSGLIAIPEFPKNKLVKPQEQVETIKQINAKKR
jgi:hypothetical protein